MKIFVKNFVSKNNFIIYTIFFSLLFFSIISSLYCQNYYKEYNNIKLNEKDNLTFEIEIELNKDLLDKYIKDILFIFENDTYYVYDVNNKYNLENNEVIIGSNKCDIDDVINLNKEEFKIKKCIERNNFIMLNNSYINYNIKKSYTFVVNNYNNKQKIINYLEKNNYLVENINSYNYKDFSTLFSILYGMLFTILLILNIIILTIFNKDDKEINNLLRVFGYSKIKLIFINIWLMIIYMTNLYILNNIIVYILKALLFSNYTLNYGLLIVNILYLYLIIISIIIVLDLIFYNFIYKKTKIKI